MKLAWYHRCLFILQLSGRSSPFITVNQQSSSPAAKSRSATPTPAASSGKFLPPAHVVCGKVIFSIMSLGRGVLMWYTPRADTPLRQTVRILLECILVNYVAHTSVGKWVVGIRLKCLIVCNCFDIVTVLFIFKCLIKFSSNMMTHSGFPLDLENLEK